MAEGERVPKGPIGAESPAKAEPKPADARFGRFLDLARRTGCDESGETFGRVLRTIARTKRSGSVRGNSSKDVKSAQS